MTGKEQAEQPSFEHKLEELEKLVEQLESGELELADSLDKFKRGIELSKQCREMLDDAQQTIDEVMEPDQDSAVQDGQADSGQSCETSG